MEGTEFWIDQGPYASSHAFYSALGHENEPLYPVMKDNWAKMKAADSSINWQQTTPCDVDFGVDMDTDSHHTACHCPMVSNIKYAPTTTCGGKDHCSTAIDDSVPFIAMDDGDKFYVYGASVWPALFKNSDVASPCSK